MARYQILTTFTTDRRLTLAERNELACNVHVQVTEPADSAGDSTTYYTSDVDTTVWRYKG